MRLLESLGKEIQMVSGVMRYLSKLNYASREVACVCRKGERDCWRSSDRAVVVGIICGH